MLSSQAQDALYIHDGASLKAHSGSAMGIAGDIVNDGRLDINESCAILVGTAATSISGTEAIKIDTLVLKMGAATTVSTELTISNYLDFNQGIIQTDVSDANSYVHFLNGATYTSASWKKSRSGQSNENGK